MLYLVTDGAHIGHAKPGHAECPERITAIYEHFRATGLLESMAPLAARDASDEELRLVHTPEHIERMRALCAAGGGRIDADTYATADSFRAAARAAGGALAAREAVLTGPITRAFCLLRPPGHHAMPNRAMGFCLFNNVAIAAKYLQRKGRRVLIIDWDCHHGNGTQAAVEEDVDIHFLSIHRRPMYPGTGGADERGCGNISNIPLGHNTPASRFFERFAKGLDDARRMFDPDFLLISCGFDAWRGDLLGGGGLEMEDFWRLTRLALGETPESGGAPDASLRPIPVVSVLEGGYDVKALGRCAEAHVRALMGLPPAS